MPHIEFFSLSQLHPPPTITPHLDFAEIMENNSCSHTVNEVAPFEGDSDNEDSAAMNLDLLESELSDDEVLLNNQDIKIPKPSREPGWPNSGGYNIKNKLCAWGADKTSEVMKFVKAKADELLDTTQSYSKQNLAEITKICGLTTKRFSIVDKYDKRWPVWDMLKLHLKYTSEMYQKLPKAMQKKTKVQ